MSVLKEFKEFAMKGNVIDLAVWVVIGTAFGKIVSSVVGDVIMPLVWVITGGIDFKGLEHTVGGAVVKYGAFIQSVVDFIIIAFCIFIVVKMMNKALPKNLTLQLVDQVITSFSVRSVIFSRRIVKRSFPNIIFF